VGSDQLLPHVMHWHDEHAKCNTLVNDHQYDGHRSYWGVWQQVIHISCRTTNDIACRPANSISYSVVHDTNDHVSLLSQSHECMLYVFVMQVSVWVWLVASCSVCSLDCSPARHITFYVGYTTVCDCMMYLWRQTG